MNQQLAQKLASAHSISEIRNVLADEGLTLSEPEIVQGLIAEGASPRFAGLSPAAQGQLAQVLVLAEQNPTLAKVLVSPGQVQAQLPALVAAAGLTLDQEVLDALAAPVEISDEQLEQVVGGIDPVLATLITLGITTAASVAMHLINRYFDYKEKSIK